ncbi:MAG: folate-binding protein, partial [Alphaproteobacteria bacterium]|nr:folate-binding protein [Alphaproteobacteria bacterium]
MTSGFIHLPQRTIVSLRGPDTMALLERLVTNATTEWASGETRYGALLTPQGKIIADYLALRTDDGVILDVSKDHAADLAKRLKMFRLRSDVEIEVLDHLHVMASLAPDQVPLEGAAYIYQDPRYPDGRTRVLVEETIPDANASALAAYHADRIANVVPEQGADFGAAEVFPAEINMDALNGVALNKGCFVGQEVVSRMHRRGKIRKRTLSATVPETLNVQPGDDI